MKVKVTLPNGKITLISKEDLSIINAHSWYVSTSGYVVCYDPSDTSGDSKLRLHRIIMKAPKGLHVDHIDGNKLNNTRNNLRLVTGQQNSFNRSAGKNNTSGYKGVSWSKVSKKWRAYITVNCKQIHLGLFDSKEDARAAHIEAQIKYHGEYACLR